MKMQINDKYRINSSGKNLILEEYRTEEVESGKKNARKSGGWEHIGYYGTVEQLSEGLARRLCVRIDAVEEIKEEIRKLRGIFKKLKGGVE